MRSYLTTQIFSKISEKEAYHPLPGMGREYATGSPIATISIAIPFSAAIQLKSEGGILLTGNTTPFMITHITIPYNTARSNL